MTTPNMHYAELKESYLFYNIAQKVNKYLENNPGSKVLRLGIGDVTLPLCPAVIDALHAAVDDQSKADSFHGYMPECGAPFLREAIASHYAERGVKISTDEAFVSSGASDELGDILSLFDSSNTALIPEPAYPAYVDANVMEGREVIHLPTDEVNGFLPRPDSKYTADIIYLCSPNNPTGSVFTKELLRQWIEFANEHQSIIIFDAAYEAFIEDEDIPHSIFEIEGAKTCAIEISSLSKTAGFTGVRLGYTVIPKELSRNGMSFNAMWVRNRTTKTNGVSYIIQKGASAVFTAEGQRQIKEIIGVYKQNARILTEALDKVNMKYYGGKNAPYIWMKCPEGMDSWTLFDHLLNEAGIVGTPGEGFGKCASNFFRFTSFGKREDTEEAAKKLVELFK